MGVQKTQQLLIIDELSSLLHSEKDSDIQIIFLLKSYRFSSSRIRSFLVSKYMMLA